MASKSSAYRWKKPCVRSAGMCISLHVTSSDPGLPNHGPVSLFEKSAERGYGKLSQDKVEFRLSRVQVHIRFEAPAGAHGQAGMQGIDLPGMDVEDHRPSLVVHPAGHSLDEPVGKQPQVTAAEKAQRLPE